MKKIVLFIAFIMSGMIAQAQTYKVEDFQAKELNLLEKIVTYEHKHLAFNKNQKAKLERLFYKKSKEIIDLRMDESVQKHEFGPAYQKIQDKYKPLVEEILTPAQKIEYRRHENKRIKT
ncbi:MAG: hypothetical protein AAGA77_07525 [Bacteroidota bacterium]